MKYPFEAADRKFLHDLASPITIAKMMVNKSIQELSKHENAAAFGKQIERLNKSLEAIEVAEKLHADFRIVIAERSGPNQSDASKRD